MGKEKLVLHPAEALKVTEILLRMSAQAAGESCTELSFIQRSDEQLGRLLRNTLWGGNRRLRLQSITIERVL